MRTSPDITPEKIMNIDDVSSVVKTESAPVTASSLSPSISPASSSRDITTTSTGPIVTPTTIAAASVMYNPSHVRVPVMEVAQPIPPTLLSFAGDYNISSITSWHISDDELKLLSSEEYELYQLYTTKCRYNEYDTKMFNASSHGMSYNIVFTQRLQQGDGTLGHGTGDGQQLQPLAKVIPTEEWSKYST
jgi:hypothetical protein